MNSYGSVTMRRLLLTLTLVLPFGPGACAPSDHDVVEKAAADTGMAMDQAAMHHDAPPAADPSDFSVYNAESTWRDASGAERRLGSLSGRPRVLAMIYTNCAFACPRILADMKRIEAGLPDALGDRVGFVLVTIDPERDTPKHLAEFARGARLDTARWTLLTGDEGSTLELAALLGVQYRRTGPGQWVHSNLITLLDARGEVSFRQLGLGTDPAPMLDAISSLSD